MSRIWILNNTMKPKLLVYTIRPKNRFWTLPQARNNSFGLQKLGRNEKQDKNQTQKEKLLTYEYDSESA